VKKNRLITVVCALATLLTAGVAKAGTLDAGTAMPLMTTLTSANQIVVVKHIFPVGYYNKETFSCGAQMVNRSEGTTKIKCLFG